VVAFARAQIGQPYRWAGDGPAEGGFDCSGLTRAAYASVGVVIPRTAHSQFLAGPLLPAGTSAQAGDLVFFGTRAQVHHVTIATGHGSQIIHAPDVGQRVRLDDWRALPDVLAISRPAFG
jgi:cell wall-associated NlpC family hydrolase